jgi:type IV secretion system protein VirB6
VFAIFPGTRGLFEGWLKAVVSSALTPLFTVLIGGAMLTLITPLIRNALLDSNDIAARSATGLFLAACIYSALMVIVARTAGTIVSGWRIPFLHAEPIPATSVAATTVAIPPALMTNATSNPPMGERVRSMIAALPPAATDMPDASGGTSRARTVVMGIAPTSPALPSLRADARVNGLGSRFRTRPDAPARAHLS